MFTFGGARMYFGNDSELTLWRLDYSYEVQPSSQILQERCKLFEDQKCTFTRKNGGTKISKALGSSYQTTRSHIQEEIIQNIKRLQ